MEEKAYVKKNKGRDFWSVFQAGGLALAIPFEMAAGPFIGYFIGMHLKYRFGMHDFFIYLLTFMGLLAGFINTVAIIRMMLKITRGDNG
jgi:F0F1-type ATP synthase assembly protein I